eukprot:1461042-Karenia_brevis.AAC.1
MPLPEPPPRGAVEVDVISSSPASTQHSKKAKGISGSHRGLGSVPGEQRTVQRQRMASPGSPRVTA